MDNDSPQALPALFKSAVAEACEMLERSRAFYVGMAQNLLTTCPHAMEAPTYQAPKHCRLRSIDAALSLSGEFTVLESQALQRAASVVIADAREKALSDFVSEIKPHIDDLLAMPTPAQTAHWIRTVGMPEVDPYPPLTQEEREALATPSKSEQPNEAELARRRAQNNAGLEKAVADYQALLDEEHPTHAKEGQ